jgi:hypothetical protein
LLRVFGHGLARDGRIAFFIEQVVGKLEGLPERIAVSDERSAVLGGRPAQHGTRLAGKPEQRAGLQRLHLGDSARVHGRGSGGEIEGLAFGHALPA